MTRKYALEEPDEIGLASYISDRWDDVHPGDKVFLYLNEATLVIEEIMRTTDGSWIVGAEGRLFITDSRFVITSRRGRMPTAQGSCRTTTSGVEGFAPAPERARRSLSSSKA